MKARFLALIAAVLFTGGVALADVSQSSLTLFSNEQDAQKHCVEDQVVWLNLPTGVYHFKGQRWYGNTKSGAFVCKREADASGDRPTKNGQ